MTPWRTIGRTIVDYALPPRCPGCGLVTADDHRFCAACWQSLDFLAGQACGRCGEPIGAEDCLTCEGAAGALDGIAAAVVYGPIARRLALRLKYGRRPGLAVTMAAAMVRLVKTDAPALLVPVPLHRWRLWTRGFNQAALIARELSVRTGHAFAPDALVRTRATPRLRGLGATARVRVVNNAFAVARPVAVTGRRILLIDDVVTSGATARACAVTLKAAGATEVRAICWARVPPPERSARH